MAQLTSPAHTHSPAGLGAWQRFQRDKPWWLLPATVVTVLGAFTVYATWTAFLGPGDNHVSEAGPYLSPFFSPLIAPHGAVTPALWVLWSPLLFRGTCYYYRKAYHRSFLLDPPACTVGELRHRRYGGETRFPLILNNLHRFFLYATIVVVVFLWIDVVKAFIDHGHLYIGFGSLLMLLNVVLLSGYTFGCHSFRHLAGGGLDCYSCVRGGRARYGAWRAISRLNVNHAFWAWVSMLSVVAVDVYIRMLQTNLLTDLHIVVG